MTTTQEQSNTLLTNIKQNLLEIENLHKYFALNEADFVYRFYHQSFKVFNAIDQIEMAQDLFEKIAPSGILLNIWYSQIADNAINKSFDWETTNPNWLNETRPILEAFWHSKYFLEQMLHHGKVLNESPQLLPSGWAAVLYLYNLR